MNNLPAVQEYQDMLKAVAFAFLERHQCEHLGDDQQLFQRAVQHLVADYNAVAQHAERLVHLASSEMLAVSDRQRLDIVSSTSTHTVIIDTATGNAWAIPVSLIYERILIAPDNGRFRVTAS
ncbi:hypothetical protein [Pseudomonas nunensis]|uniref:Prophage PssSM-01 n=1 Tax=Pseudomonas nunensis TaxID=2961896 RepID=A0ABY5EAV1_9PSED|nr:hypothetical protein [Pseudomonas nunensis]KPN91720.1 hypothetical protein AL066_15805 [Pseudomonas nunensis]MCL5229583.1 hypothetical protein [Pseudomonas nunensis]UTO11922.1 hypothetical protein NK667_17240 [Pseudomonas nunensis]